MLRYALPFVLLVAVVQAADTDPRNIRNGLAIPDEGYCDQPYVVVTRSGGWLCTMTTGQGKEGQKGQHIVATTSRDQGRTWSPLVDIEPADGPEASWVTPLVVPSGRVYAFYTYNGDNVTTLRGKAVRADTHGWYCYRFSDDEGKTWSPRRRIPLPLSACDRQNDFDGKQQMFWGIDKPKIAGDSVYFAFTKLGKFFLQEGEGWLVRSDNILTEADPEKLRFEILPEGDRGLRSDYFGSVQEEHNLVPLSGNGLYCVYRTTLGFPCHTYSRDGGRTWDPPSPMTYATPGRVVKNPRACPKLFRTANGKYLFWFHNNSGKSFEGRNPVWLCGGVERDGRIQWSQPEIVLYDPDPKTRMSYPDLVEQDGHYWFTETQKTVARVHEVDAKLIDGLWAQLERRAVSRSIHDSEEGVGVHFWFKLEDLAPGVEIVDRRDEARRGFVVKTAEFAAVRIEVNDGANEICFESDRGVLTPNRPHHVAFLLDAGPQIIMCLVDGVLCDGGPDRTQGWEQFRLKTSKVVRPGVACTSADRVRLGSVNYGNYYVSQAVDEFNAGPVPVPLPQFNERGADRVFLNGKIVTVDPAFRIAEAMAVKGERIVAVGSNEDVRRFSGPKTKEIDLKGKCVLPGLIDSHLHATDASTYEFDHDVPQMDTVADVLAYVKDRAEKLGEGKWIVVQQVFITRLRDQRFPTREELDKAAPNNPVIFRTGPDASLNSLALKLSGIDKDYKVPEGVPGKVERAADGAPTGILRSAQRLIKFPTTGRKPTFDDRCDRLRQQLAAYNAEGLTGITDRIVTADSLQVFERLREKDQLTCRVFGTYFAEVTQPWEKIEATIDDAAKHPAHKYDNRLWLRGLKIYFDGGMLTGSAYMLKPWGVSPKYGIDDPEYRGMRYLDDEKLYRIAKAALGKELQLTAHAVGDGAVEAMVAAYERVNREFPVRDARPCICHSNFMTAAAIDKMAALGIVADLQPVWLYLDGATLRRHFGAERLTYFQPYKTLFDRGVIVGGGSDHMQKIDCARSINSYSPWLGMWTTLTRLPRWTDEPLHPAQVITRRQAIQLYTINNAWLTFEEREKGSLEAGKLADFIVLDRDVLKCPVDQIKDTRVLETWLGGTRVYERE